ncbi:MAG TPA: neuraminidase-like domain-containing protein [Luteibacter sp.]|uniref:neuraminidase-like domain-containing protein n=1 Tax=Luteibacter sp. TaxID=1886636 RepID=UPI002BFA92BC|nr:neuraminidase-like domain-containing protein [Luteibacter sp.]HVI54975.1 neuraminidase-like domain-containing protein [Luteibacter sp.]
MRKAIAHPGEAMEALKEDDMTDDTTTTGTQLARTQPTGAGNAATYTGLFAWPKTVQPGALNDNTNPLAYVHDLFVLATTLEAGADASQAHPLDQRRPDLGAMPMDEQSLKQTFPALRFAIDRLEDTIRESQPEGAETPLHEAIAQAAYPTSLPFHFAWEQVKTVLAQRKLTIWDVVRKSDPDYPNFTFGNVTSTSLRAAMTLSNGFAPEMRAHLTADPSTASDSSRTVGTLAELTVADTFRRRLGLSRKQLRQMLAVYQPGKAAEGGIVDRQPAVVRSAYVSGDDAPVSSATFGAAFVNDGGDALYLRYEDDDENQPIRIEGLTEGHVDRILRVLRVHHATKLSFADIDVLLTTALRAEGQTTGLHMTDSTLRALGLFQHLREKYSVTASQFASFIGDMPSSSNGRERSFYDTLFNPSGIEPRSDSESVFTIDGSTFDLYATAGADAIAVRQLSQALKADEATVRWALERVVETQCLTAATRSLAVVSACYRLIALPRVFGLKTGEAPVLITALNRENPNILRQLAGVPTLDATTTDVGEAWSISTTGDDDLELALDDMIDEVLLAERKKVLQQRTDALDVIAIVMNAAEWAIQHKRRIDALCLPLLAPAPTQPAKRWIDATHRAIAALAAPDEERLADDDIVGAAIQQGLQLKDLALALPLLRWTARTTGDVVASLQALGASTDAVTTPEGTKDVTHCLGADELRLWNDLERYAAVAMLFGLSAAGLTAMVDHPTWFNLASEDGRAMRPLDFTTIYQVSRYADWLAALPEGSDEDQAIDYFRQVHENRSLTSEQCAAMLSRLTGGSQDVMASIASRIDSKTIADTVEDLRDIDFVMRLQELAHASGLSVDALFDVNTLKFATDHAAFEIAAAALVAACSEEDAAAVEGIHGERWRDALVAWMLETWVPSQPALAHVTDAEALSDHLLLDVMVGREPVTSRVASAMASLQTYVHRLLSGLEPGHDINPAITQDVRDTWNASQSQYGRWKLLRQLKNYPENRIDPTRRPRKTSAYADLENLLAQGKFSGEDIQTAILAYLTSFEATSNIQPLTAYHDGVDPAHDTYHFIGKSNVSPAQYYWRTLDMSVRDADGAPSMLGWSAWEPISLPVNGTIATTPLPSQDTVNAFDIPASTKQAIAEDPRKRIDTIRPVVIDGRRYVVWVERDTTGVPLGKDQKTSPFFALRVCYCYQQIDGLWGPSNVLIELNGREGSGNLDKSFPTAAAYIEEFDFKGETCYADKKGATDNYYLKTKHWSPGLVVMVNTSGHRKHDPWLTVLLFQAGVKDIQWKRDRNYYFASRDLLLLEEKQLDRNDDGTIRSREEIDNHGVTHVVHIVPIEDALRNDWLTLFSDPRVVQHQYAGKVMDLVEKEQALVPYAVKDEAAAALAGTRYGLAVDKLGAGLLDASMIEGKDFIEIRAGFDGNWTVAPSAPVGTGNLLLEYVSPVGDSERFRVTARADIGEKVQDDEFVDVQIDFEWLTSPDDVMEVGWEADYKICIWNRKKCSSWNPAAPNAALPKKDWKSSISIWVPKERLTASRALKANLLRTKGSGEGLLSSLHMYHITLTQKNTSSARLFEYIGYRDSSKLYRITAKADIPDNAQDSDLLDVEFTVEWFKDYDVINGASLSTDESARLDLTFPESDTNRRPTGQDRMAVCTLATSKKRLTAEQGLNVSLRVGYFYRASPGPRQSIIEENIVLAPNAPANGKARLVLRGGIDQSKVRDITLSTEDNHVLTRLGLDGLRKFAQDKPKDFAAIRAQLAFDPPTDNDDFYKRINLPGCRFGGYTHVSDCVRRARHEKRDDVADFYIDWETAWFSTTAITPPPGVTFRNAVKLKHYYPDTYARFMVATQVENNILAQTDVVLDGSDASRAITIRFPANNDVALYTFQLDVYSEDDTAAIGSITRQYNLVEKKTSRWSKGAGHVDDAVPSARLVQNRYQVHYLDLTEVNAKAADAKDRLPGDAVRLNTLIGMRFAALATKSARSVLDWEVQVLPSPRMEPGQPDGMLDFDGANGLYFWELFFHMPMLVAWQLRSTRQYREAFDWCTQHLFDPYDSTGTPGTFRPPLWHSRPLANLKAALAVDADVLTDDVDDLAYAEPERYRKAAFLFLVDFWRQQGDDFYRQLTRDDINEAANCYRKALRLIGPLPEQMTAASPALPTLAGTSGKDFLPPVNVALTDARDLLQNRLFNIRHGLTIDGKRMDLDLYDAADDVASLGHWRTGRLSGTKRIPRIDVPPHRFKYVLPSAKEAVAQLIDMGGRYSTTMRRSTTRGSASFSRPT